MALNAHFRSTSDRLVVPVARVVAKTQVTPNVITTVGLCGVIVGMAVLLLGAPGMGAAIMAVATALDALDGTVARLTNADSDFGAFYDSVADRISDAIIFGGAAWIVRDQPVVLATVLVALAAALITSYVRAKAEALGWDCTVGLIERPERVMIMIPALGFGVVHYGAIILAVGGAVTVAQRLWTVYVQAHSARPATSRPATARPAAQSAVATAPRKRAL